MTPTNPHADRKQQTFRFKISKNEYLFARAKEILALTVRDNIIRACIAKGGQTRWATRCGSLASFIAKMPRGMLKKVHRNFAINIKRASGGNEKKRTIEFDFLFIIPMPDEVSMSFLHHLGI